MAQDKKYLTWDEYYLLPPLFIELFPDCDVETLNDEEFAMKVQMIARFYDSRFYPPHLDILTKLKWLIIDQMDDDAEDDDIIAVGYC